MTAIYVQFTDGTATTVMSIFAGPQDTTAYPDQAILLSTDARYQAWYSALPALMKNLGGFVVPGA